MLRVDRTEVRAMFDALGAEEGDGLDSFQVE
jgi:hypothetical protein